MKKLIDFLEEELKSEKHKTLQIADLNTPGAIEKSQAFWDRTENRMREDPAIKRLAELAALSTTMILSIIPREQFTIAFQRLFVEMVSIWEDAQTKFAEQFKEGPMQ